MFKYCRFSFIYSLSYFFMAGYTTYTVIPSYIDHMNILFDKLTKDLYAERSKIEESINAWADTLRFQIEDHVSEQKSLLQSYYNDRKRILDQKRYETDNEIRKYYSQYEYNKIQDLLGRCKTLKFELLVKFTYKDQPLSFIQCVTKEHLEQQNKNESSATKTENYTSEAKLKSKDSKDPGKNRGVYTDISTIGQQTT
jgi:hypothetical protein